MTKWIAFYTFQRNHNLLGGKMCLVYYMAITFTVNNYKATWCIVYMGNIIHNYYPNIKKISLIHLMKWNLNIMELNTPSSYLFRILFLQAIWNQVIKSIRDTSKNWNDNRRGRQRRSRRNWRRNKSHCLKIVTKQGKSFFFEHTILVQMNIYIISQYEQQ